MGGRRRKYRRSRRRKTKNVESQEDVENLVEKEGDENKEDDK